MRERTKVMSAKVMGTKRMGAKKTGGKWSMKYKKSITPTEKKNETKP